MQISTAGYEYIYSQCQDSPANENYRQHDDPQLAEKLTVDEVGDLKAEFEKYLRPQDVGMLEYVLTFLTEGKSAYKQYNGYVSAS